MKTIVALQVVGKNRGNALHVKGLAPGGHWRQSRTSKVMKTFILEKPWFRLLEMGFHAMKKTDQEVMTKAEGKTRLPVVASLTA